MNAWQWMRDRKFRESGEKVRLGKSGDVWHNAAEAATQHIAADLRPSAGKAKKGRSSSQSKAKPKKSEAKSTATNPSAAPKRLASNLLSSNLSHKFKLHALLARLFPGRHISEMLRYESWRLPNGNVCEE